MKQTANFLFSWRDFCDRSGAFFWNKVGSSLRSRRQRKAWGVSPRIVRVENVSPRMRAAAITNLIARGDSRFRPLRGLGSRCYLTWGSRPRLYAYARSRGLERRVSYFGCG